MSTVKFITSIVFSIISVFSIDCFGQKTNQFDSDGKRTGKWSKNYSGGNLKYSGQFKSGKEVGVFKFYKNKRVNTGPDVIKDFSSSDGSTYVKYFFSQNKVEAEGKMIGKKRVGLWKYYFSDGKILSKEIYKNGKLNGASKNYYKNGKLTSEITYQDGIKNGSSKTYTNSGVLIEDVNYVNNTMDGPAKFYDLKGNLTEKGTFVNGVRSEDWDYFSADGSASKTKKTVTYKIKGK